MQGNGPLNTTINYLLKTFQRYKLFIGLCLILGLVFILLLLEEYISIPFGCPFKAITGVPCPGCGGIRAAQSLLRGEVLHALYINPLSCALCLFGAVLPFWAFYDCYRGKQSLKKCMTTRWPKWIIVVVSIVLLANWIWNIIKGL